LTDKEDSKREAISAILGILGDENLAILKRSLSKDYSIDLDKVSFYTLEELQLALQQILGSGGAVLIIREIRLKIQEFRKNAA